VPPPRLSPRRSRAAATALAAAATAALVALVAPAAAQDPDATSTTPAPTETTITTEGTNLTLPTTTTAPPTTTTLVPPNPDDPTQDEGVEAGDVPIDPAAVPPRSGDTASGAQVGKLIREQLSVAQADAVKLGTSYAAARAQLIALEAQLDQLERSVTTMAGADRAAVRRVAAARRQFEGRAIAAIIRGRIDDIIPEIPTGDPNEIVAAHALLSSVLDADDQALQGYLATRADTDAQLLIAADRLVDTRNAVAKAREAMVEARRANVSAQINLAVLAAGSDIVIHGFVFPVGVPHSFGDSFGAPRMVGTQYQHSHQGTDILAPFGTPLVACERGIVTRLGSDVLGGTTFWIKGESGTYYYYAHLSRYADGLAKGQVVESGQIVGYVGDSGNAKGTPHLHFEIHPDGGSAVNPYPLLKVVDQLSKQAAAG
jgi:murein DD-endopeptidase MepM/ murein hydrolase activator NlpD